MTANLHPAVASLLLGYVLAVAPIAAQEKPGEKDAAATESKPTYSGFLGDYSDLVPHPKSPNQMMVYRKAVGILADYDRIMVLKPLIYFHPEAKGTGIDPAELSMLSDFLHTELVEALKHRGYQVVDEAGSGVLVLRSAITDVDPVDPKKNVGSKAAGAALGIGLLVPRADLGRAAVEAEMLDGETGERVAAVVARRDARRYGGLIKGAKRWGDVKAAFKKWAKAFSQQLDRARES